MKTYFIRKTIYTIGIISAVMFLSGRIMTMLWGEDYSVNKLIFKSLLRLVLIFGTLYILKKENLINWKYTYKNSIAAIIVSFVIIYFSWQHFIDKTNELNVKVPVWEHLMYFFNCLTTGFFEEWFFRVLIFAYFCKIFPGGNSNYKPVVWTSFIFAIVHFTAFLTGTIDFASVINQIVFAFFIGIFLQSILYRFNNILIGSILHAAINYNGMIKQNLFKIQSHSDEGSFEDFIISLGIFMLIALFITLPIAYMSFRNRRNYLIKD